jgi:outer membrane lipoprotein-sorting protein
MPQNICFAMTELERSVKGTEIGAESYRRESGFIDFFAELTLVQKDKHNKDIYRHIRLWGLERESKGDKSISVFIYPPDVKGFARLTYTHTEKPDDHWLYIPEKKRVKRLSPSSQLSLFMGSQFSFEDLRLYRAEKVEKFTYRYLYDEIYEELDCYVVERFSRKEYSNYSRQVIWFDKEEYRILKIDFYDKSNKLLKTLTKSEYELYEGRFWCMRQMKMVNHQNGEETLVLWNNYTFNLGLTENDFTQNSLKRFK